ncbi:MULTISPECIES: SMP-30/gluconolactonase/LRE family protein [Bacteria]|uniref:SMP-30/gluconolactonase/LRE family protein n=1 Tax=Bacteria TaxID=2 RepID=UPI003C7CF97E
MTPENLTGPVSWHAEGPVWWSGPRGGLRWVDADAGDLLALTDDGVRRTHVDDEYLAFVRPRANGGYVAVGARSIHLSSDPECPPTASTALAVGSTARMNDGCCDPRGRLLAGSMGLGTTPDGGSLVRIGRDLTPTTVLPAVAVSNGIGFTGDGTLAYYVDSLTRRIDVFDVDEEGELVERRPFARLADADGLPDGLTVDAGGGVWVAAWGGSAVLGYDDAGMLRERIALPVPQVSACTFGGDDLGTLFVTTSAQGLPHDHGTDAGSVYAVRPGTRGLPVLPFAG